MAIKQLPSSGWPGGKKPQPGVPLPESLTPGGEADSAGYSWEGRNFDHHGTAFADDDGHTPDSVAEAVSRIRTIVQALSAECADAAKHLADLAEAHADAIVAFAKSRLLVPLIADAGDYGVSPEGKIVEKTQELSIVTVAAPDGRKVLPVFSSAGAMQRWNPLARPIPVPGVQVAIAAAEEATDLVIVDPGSAETEFGIRRPALESFALAKPHTPSWANPDLEARFVSVMGGIEEVLKVVLVPGDPQARLLGPETVAMITLRPGLKREDLDRVGLQINHAIASDEVIGAGVDSLALRFARPEN